MVFRLITALRERLHGRPDSEHVQPFLRAVAGTAAAVYALFTDISHGLGYGFGQTTQIWICLVGGFFTGGLGFFSHILAYPAKNHLRRTLGLVHDMVWCGLALYAFGDGGILIWGMYIWLVIGYGFRYGVHYLYAASAIALISFYTVAYFSPYYRNNYELMALGTFLLALVIPVYLGSLLRTLQKNLEAAREADRLKTRFLANVSHDLRTPLNVIMANCEVLGRDLQRSKELLRPVIDMQEAAKTLSGLISNLLDVAKIEAGRIRLESSPFNVAQLLGRIRRFNEVTARQQGTRIYLTVDPNTPTKACGDKLRLEQILSNIVSNAVKYTENGYIHIDARPDVDAATGTCKGLLCSVRDTGIGMDADATDRIFSRFEQADVSYARRYSGAGLGLSIARELVSLMGGSITVESEKGKGSCFTVSLPLNIDRNAVSEPLAGYDPDSLLVICSPVRQTHWRQLCNGHRLPEARICPVEHASPGAFPFTDGHSRFRCVLVDATGMQAGVEKLPDLVKSSHPSSDTPCILLNPPVNKLERAFYQAYRSVCATATTEEIRRALAIALWTRCSEQTEAIPHNHLETCFVTLKQRSVLVADDNELNRRVIANLLKYADARVIEACDGHDALRKMARHRIDIALLDVQMPELTGIEVMRCRAGQTRGDAIPMIALTADTTDQCRSECLDAGAAAIIYKPVSMLSLYSGLHRVITQANGPTGTAPAPNMSIPSMHGALDYALLKELAQSAQHPDYLPQLVACFREEGARLLRQLRDAFRNKDIAGSRALLHRLQGMSGSIGAKPVALLCHDTLASPDAHLCAYAATLTEQLYRLHREAAAALENFLTGTSLSQAQHLQ